MARTLGDEYMLLKLWYKLIRKTPDKMPMVKYWKTQDSVQAKVIRAKEGHQMMVMEGEDEPFPTFPRGYMLYGRLSKLKHEIKNQIFNDSWWALEDGKPRGEVIANAKEKLFGEVMEIMESMRYDMLPYKSLTPSVKEIYRAFTAISDNPKVIALRDLICFILQEDDAYRFRVQWLAKYFRWYTPSLKALDKGLAMMEHAEVIGDMKERIRLLRRILLLCLEDKNINELYRKLTKEIKWRKVKLTKADKYHFRGKYFKVDYPELEY